MASISLSCVVCFNNESNFILCSECNNGTCLSCLNTYKKLNCPNCLIDYPDAILKDYFEENKDLYINYYIYKKIQFNDETNTKIINYFKEAELKKIIFFGDKDKIKGIVKSSDKILKCKTCNNLIIGNGFCNNCIRNNEEINGILTCKKCFGIISKEGLCVSCKYKICTICEETFHGDTKCDEKKLHNLMEIQKTCKKCPSCFSYISRTEGCAHMKCIYCGATFDWNNPKFIEKNKFEYRNDSEIFINKELNKNYNKQYEYIFNKQNLENVTPEKLKKVRNNNKKKLKPVNNYSSEDIHEFLNYLNKDFKSNEILLEKLTIEYFTLLRKEVERNETKGLTQLEINYFLDKKNLKKIFLSLKKQEYYMKINEKMLSNDIQNIINIKKNLTEIDISLIIPDEIKFFIDENNSKIVTYKTSSKKQKIKEENLFVEDNSKEKSGITLLNEEQEIHANQIYHIIKRFRSCLNTSHAGSGKTYTSIYVANKLNIKHLILFFPKIIQKKWLEIIEKYNQLYQFNMIYFTYSEISSSSFKINNNVYKTVVEKDKLVVKLNPDFSKKINKNTLIILDEIHNIKSTSSLAFKFIETVTRFAIDNDSYVLSLSATPIDKKTEMTKLFKKLSFVDTFNAVPMEQDKYIAYNIKKNNNFDSELSNIDNFMEEERLVSYQKIEDKNFGKRIKFIISEITKGNLNQDYINLIQSLNSREFRNKKWELISVLKNFLKHKISLNTLLNDFIEKSDEKFNIYLDTEILDFIYEQNFATHLILSYKYILYLVKQEKKIKKTLNKSLSTLILYLYGTDIYISIFVGFTNNINTIIEKLNKELFNLKTFNIFSHLNKKNYLELKNLKLLEINLKNEDKNILRTAFEQVLINLDNKLSISSLENFALMTKGLIISELTYVSYIIEIVTSLIDKQIKIIIGTHYTETIRRFKDKFNNLDFNYLLIDGSVNDKNKIINLFQTRKDKKILLVNIKCANTGIDLDDKIGDEPRVVFIIPDFKFSETVQFMFRFKRIDSKSEPYVFLLYNHIYIIRHLFDKSSLFQNLNTNLPNLNAVEKISQDNIFSTIFDNKK